MDSSHLQRSNSVPSKREIKRKASALVESRRSKFFANYKSQEFSLPDAGMFYLAKNPTSPELYEKMIQTCKYFFVKNPVLDIPEIGYCGDDKWKLFSVIRPIDLSNFISKLWITNKFFAEPENSVIKKAVNQNILSSLMPKLYQCDAKTVFLKNQIIFFHDLSRLIPSAENIYFINITVKDENDSNVAVEKIIEIAVKAKRILIRSHTTLLNITLNTVKELIKLPHFSKLGELWLDHIPESFDLETFYSYMKQNKTTEFRLEFDNSVSEAYKNRLEKIIDKILTTETHDYKPPCIDFDELDDEKFNKLYNIYLSH